MKHHTSCLISKLATVMAAAAFTAHAPAATLLDELNRVVPNHPQVLSASSQFNALQAEVDIAKAPSNVRGGIEGGPRFGRNLSGGSSAHTPTWAAKLSFPVYDGGRVANDVARVSQRAEAQNARIAEAQRDIASKVAQAYVEVVKRKTLLLDAQAHLKQLTGFAVRMQRIVVVDPGRAADYSQALSRMAQQEQTIASRKAELADAQGSYIALTSSDLVAAQEPQDYALANFQTTALDALVESSPTVRAAVAEMEAEKSSLALASAWEKPSISLVTRLDSRVDSKNNNKYFDAASIGFNVAWDRLDGGAGAASAAAAQARLIAGESLLNAVRREVRGQLLRVVTYAQGLEGRPESAVRSQQCANQVRVAYVKQFDVARRPLLDVLNAENDWFTQRTAALSSHYESIAARLRVAAQAGDLWPIAPGKLLPTQGLKDDSETSKDKDKDAPCLAATI